jgi:transcriptional regulator with XRE-family HTH domain
LREVSGLTQDGLAERTGLSTAYISEIERGIANPSAVVMAELAQALGVDVRELLAP